MSTLRGMVGNDVVDLDDPRTWGKEGDTRFVTRVLRECERLRLRQAPSPSEGLWRFWASKEAAYKVVSKLRDTPPVFVHRDFVVDDDTVRHEGAQYPLLLSRHGSALHAVSCSGALPEDVLVGVVRLDQPGAPWCAPLEVLLGRFSSREADPVHSLASAAVRIGARAALAAALSLDEARLEIVCAPGPTGRRPPHVLLDGDRGPADVSLSHHGGWIAWAILLH